MQKFIIYIIFAGLIISQTTITIAAEVIKSTAENSTIEKSEADVDKQPPSAIITKFKEVFQKNEQKPKRMRSKDIVKTKEKIRKQELEKKKKENEIKYLERKLEERQKTLERLEK